MYNEILYNKVQTVKKDRKKNSEKFLKSSCKINLSEYNKSIDSKEQ